MYPHNEDTSAINDIAIILNQRNNNNTVTTVTVTTTKIITTSKTATTLHFKQQNITTNSEWQLILC